MNVSARTEYACLAVMQLAASYGTGEPVRVRAIAQTHGIPSRFLVQILLQLKGAGLVASTRGAAGGYQLIKDPADITLADVMCVIEGRRRRHSQLQSARRPGTCALSGLWNDVARVQREMLAGTTIQDLLERAQANRTTCTTSGRSGIVHAHKF